MAWPTFFGSADAPMTATPRGSKSDLMSGTGGVGAHFDPDRVRAPLLRASVRGEEKWTEVTWDEALGHVAEKLQTIKAEYGPEAVALYSTAVTIAQLDADLVTSVNAQLARRRRRQRVRLFRHGSGDYLPL